MIDYKASGPQGNTARYEVELYGLDYFDVEGDTFLATHSRGGRPTSVVMYYQYRRGGENSRIIIRPRSTHPRIRRIWFEMYNYRKDADLSFTASNKERK